MSYWDAIDSAIVQLKKARTVDEVLEICGGATSQPRDGFWGGDGDEMLGALYDAGWKCHWYDQPYLWVLKDPDGGLLSYVEGDLYRGDNEARGV